MTHDFMHARRQTFEDRHKRLEIEEPRLSDSVKLSRARTETFASPRNAPRHTYNSGEKILLQYDPSGSWIPLKQLHQRGRRSTQGANRLDPVARSDTPDDFSYLWDGVDVFVSVEVGNRQTCRERRFDLPAYL